ncbi:hypothetical protein BSU04_05775 [Caballeronia sordidicola]|uniref:Uncharacterized protein n=1 Tax=Caballeronia sordidicola TaxID=196367 RepID=A0A226X839_CABSO|nr:hypothetical protein BSU04_05775 [Caballeronia sordidicola]
MGLVGRLPACFCASSLARGFGQASYNPKHKRTFDNAALIVDNVISFETTDIE